MFVMVKHTLLMGLLDFYWTKLVDHCNFQQLTASRRTENMKNSVGMVCDSVLATQGNKKKRVLVRE